MFCKDCKWWRKFDYSHLGECKSTKKIIVEDDEGWGCQTGPLFGCIHFEAKEKTKRSSQDYTEQHSNYPRDTK